MELDELNEETVVESSETTAEKPQPPKKNTAWIWILVAAVAVIGLAIWCIVSANNANGVTDIFGINLGTGLFCLR